jgi:hypothetical protein
MQQYSLSKGAYNYWNQKKVDLLETGGMYTTQPGQPVSNIRNVNDPEEVVLGYFWASEKTEKRFFNQSYRPYDYDCDLILIEEYMSHFSDDSLYWERNPDTIFVFYDPESEDPPKTTINKYCFDCRELGGSIIRPEFWDDFQ